MYRVFRYDKIPNYWPATATVYIDEEDGSVSQYVTDEAGSPKLVVGSTTLPDNIVTGNGTLGKIPKFSGTGSLDNSSIEEKVSSIKLSKAIEIVDGTQGAGKVLTSDATGLASWQTLTLPKKGYRIFDIPVGTYEYTSSILSDDITSDSYVLLQFNEAHNEENSPTMDEVYFSVLSVSDGRCTFSVRNLLKVGKKEQPLCGSFTFSYIIIN